MLQLSQRVCSKRTGLPMTGTVVGCIMPVPYYNHLAMQGYQATTWDQLYPKWKEKYLYYVYFDTPAKNCSKEECPPWLNYESIPLSIMAVYPEEDLEILE